MPAQAVSRSIYLFQNTQLLQRMKSIRFEIIDAPHTNIKGRYLPAGVKGDRSLMMWKELCRTGHYETDGAEHDIDEDFFDNMIQSFKRRKAKGIEVPCPVGHTRDPEKKRGRVLHLETRQNDAGGVSLWGIIEFLNAEYKHNLENSDVSIDAPEVVSDGDGETYPFALESVAFTDYPVVAGMKPFQGVKFSLWSEASPAETENWTIDALIARLGLTKKYSNVGDVYKDIYQLFERLTGKRGEKILEADDAQPNQEEAEMAKKSKKFEACDDKKLSEEQEEKKLSRKKKFSEEDEDDDFRMAEEDKEFSTEDDEEDGDGDIEEVDGDEYDDDVDDAEFENDDDEVDVEDYENEEDAKKLARRKGKKFSRFLGDTIRENRMLRINDMRRKGQITAEQSNEMKKQFCSDRSISFSLASDRGNAEFERVCKLMKAGTGRNYAEKTGVQFGRYTGKGADSETAFADFVERKFK